MSDSGRNSLESPNSAKAEDNGNDDKTFIDKYDVEAAEILANAAQQSPLNESVPVYEQLLLTFPTAGKFWKQFVEAHMAVNNYDATKQIFSRCLLTCLYIPLWHCYIRFIKKVNENKGMDGVEETRKAFEFMLSYIGSDISAGPVWIEYINFLKSLQALSTQEESQRMTAVRKAYQKAIVTPTHQIDQLWKEYENFENSVSKALAKGLLSEYQPRYISAKAFYRERKKFIDDIDWNMLAVPPTGSYKEEVQWVAWKRYLDFEKGNLQRIESALANKRIAFTYEQCLMYLYHYPDIWFDYATWHSKSGSPDASIKVFQRAVKAHSGSEVLKYAYAELEESRGSIQAAKGIYESFLDSDANATPLAHIQFIRFLRRNEGVEAARKYFLDVRKLPSCTYHVYISYALVALCLDKDQKVAHNVFEAGLKHFMHEPAYILEYADFLSRLNDDRNVRALFERALSSLPADASVEVWKRFVQFEKTYGDLASMMKVDQRRREVLSTAAEEEVTDKNASLQDVASRYNFMDLWPCSSKDLDLLNWQELLEKKIRKKVDKPPLPNGASLLDTGFSGNSPVQPSSVEFVYPETSKMLIYEPRQKPDSPISQSEATADLSSVSNSLPASVPVVGGGPSNSSSEMWKATPPVLLAFIANLPIVEGPSPDVDLVLSICLQSNFPTPPIAQGAPGGVTPVADHSVRERQTGQRRDAEDASIQNLPLPTDAFRIRQIHRSRGMASTQSGSVSHGSVRSCDNVSGSTS